MFPFDDFACSGELFQGGLQSSGEINWLFDVVAPDQNTTARVLANFRQVVQEGGLRLHPLIGRLVDEETLKKIAGQSKGGED
ncbi:hypothetical protein RA29_00005 [Tateyamaria sp. ANG-S1]|nr:hypothetical protein RA29_00005 [Tateyamaria sp. ANG-S1]